MPLYPGDPLTPGVGATGDAKRLPCEDAPTLTKIPVLPISYADARPLLEALGGPGGARGLARRAADHLPPRARGPRKVHLKLAFDWKLVPAHDVIAVLRGAEQPDQWVVRGNHHDAWVNGATDPSSGLAAVLAEAKALWRSGAGLEAAAHDRLRGLGRRGAGPARLDRVGRGRTRAELGAQGRRLRQLRQQRPRLPRHGGLAHARALLNEVARDVSDPGRA